MGLFDNMMCKHPLPMPELFSGEDWSDHQFQTKSLNCFLESYMISESGHLFHKPLIHESLDWKLLENFTGIVEFYDNFPKDDKTYWVEFKAMIVKGNLYHKIEVTHFYELPPSVNDKYDEGEKSTI